MAWRRKRPLEDFNLEVQSHVDLEAERLTADGLDPVEARAAARRAFGNVTLAQERFYESGRLLWLDHLWRDVRFALRTLLKSPGFAVPAIVTLGIGIGASTAIFSLVKPLLLQPLPWREPHRVVRLYANNPAQNVQQQRFSLAHLLELQKQSRVFEQVVAVLPLARTLTGDGDAELIMGWLVTPGFLTTIGVEPVIGRSFLPEEESRTRGSAALIFHSLWRRRYGGDPGILGKKLTVNGWPYTVVGVLPPGFRFGHRSSEILLPLHADFAREASDYTDRGYLIYARLRRSATAAQAQVELDVVARRLEQDHPVGNKGWRIEVVPAWRDMIGPFRTALLSLLVAAGLLLAITCANVTSLSLARTAAREREMAVRYALGAGRKTVARMVLTESFLLAGFGAIPGLLLAVAGVRFLKMALPDPYGPATTVVMLDFIGIDLWVLGFAVAISLVVALLVGLPPAWRASRPNLNQALKDVGAAVAGGFRSRRIHSRLVVGEVAIVLVLVIVAGLMMQSLIRLYRTDPGFRPDHVLTLAPLPPVGKYDQARWATFYADLEQRLERFPQVVSVARTNNVPGGGWDRWIEFRVPGSDSRPGKMPRVTTRVVTAAYFPTLGIPLVAGRSFTEFDAVGHPAVAVIDLETARQYFPGEDPVGKRVELGKPGGPAYEIIGVVGSIHDQGLDKPPQPVLYFSETQCLPNSICLPSPGRVGHFMIRTTIEPRRLLPLVRAEIRKLDPDAALFRVYSTRQLLNDFVWQGRLATFIVSGLAGLALLLTTVGLYGLMQYKVACQTREIAIRLAMGAQVREVLRLWVGKGLLLVAAGIAIGVPASLALTPLIAGQLYGITPTDPATYVAVSLVLILTGVLGSYLPALHASRMDPTAALRHE